MVGLTRTDAATASLLLTLEAAATALMAWFIFRENYDRRIALGMAYLIAGAAILSWSGAPTINNMLCGEHQASTPSTSSPQARQNPGLLEVVCLSTASRMRSLVIDGCIIGQ
jgi:drug/metabolite transporter (DMT)-like permease